MSCALSNAQKISTFVCWHQTPINDSIKSPAYFKHSPAWCCYKVATHEAN